MARELAASLIRVVTIAPGIFETPMMAGLPAEAQPAVGPSGTPTHTQTPEDAPTESTGEERP